MSSLGTITTALFGLALGVAVIAFCVALWNLIRVPFLLKPGIEAWSTGNPFDYLFKPEALTPRGLEARRRTGVAVIVFFLMIGFGLAIAAASKFAA